MSPDVLLLVHLVLCAFHCGLIWIVQLVHYPLFDRVDPDGWEGFAASHRERIARVVVPTMGLEGLGAVALLPWWWGEAAPLDGWTAGLNLVGLAGIWLSTALLQVPAHRRLERRFDARAHRRLVDTNWVRTALWSARTLGLAWALSASG